MTHNSWFPRILRFVGIVLMALTAGFTVLGGIGTFCAALYPARYESMSPLIPFQWLYIFFMISGIAIGIWGIAATLMLIRGTSKSYITSIQALVAGVVVGGFHIFMSRMLRGKSMPVDAVVYTSVFTLAVFLLFRIPGIWKGVDFSKGNSKTNRGAGAAAAMLVGALTLVVPYLMASTHTWNGVNYAAAFNDSLTILGALQVLGGIGLLVWPQKVTLAADEMEKQPVMA
jgi:hypothetical protein